MLHGNFKFSRDQLCEKEKSIEEIKTSADYSLGQLILNRKRKPENPELEKNLE